MAAAGDDGRDAVRVGRRVHIYVALLHVDPRADNADSSFDRRRVSRAQKGHFAFRTDGATFWKLHAALPTLLDAHKARAQQRTDVLCDDFAVQLSMFFEDPDGNEVEVTTWDCERDDTCSRFGAVSNLSIRGQPPVTAEGPQAATTNEATSVRGATWNAAICLPFRWSASPCGRSPPSRRGKPRP